jgi:hypothetical protein
MITAKEKTIIEEAAKEAIPDENIEVLKTSL